MIENTGARAGMRRWAGLRIGNSIRRCGRVGLAPPHFATYRALGRRRLHMNVFWAELIGTAILVILGNGVVANVLLTRTKGNNSGWIVITAGWGMAVFVAILCVDQFSGAHLNPAVTIALATAKKW